MTGDNMLTRWPEQLSRSDGEARRGASIQTHWITWQGWWLENRCEILLAGILIFQETIAAQTRWLIIAAFCQGERRRRRLIEVKIVYFYPWRTSNVRRSPKTRSCFVVLLSIRLKRDRWFDWLFSPGTKVLSCRLKKANNYQNDKIR